MREQPGDRSIYDSTFSDANGSLGECWGELNHSIIEAKKKEVIGDLPKWVERFLDLKKTHCNEKDEYTLEVYEFDQRTKVTVVYLFELLKASQTKGNDTMITELKFLINSLDPIALDIEML